MRDTFLTLLALVTVALPPATARARQESKHPAFTLVSRATTHSADGEKQVVEETLYVSSNGSTRLIRKKENGSLYSDVIHESGRGSFNINHTGRRLHKRYGVPPEASAAPLPTAESLRADPHFVRTEQLLGYTAYVIREVVGGVGSGTGRAPEEMSFESYYAPEFGKSPLKVVHYRGERVVSVTEPVSVVLGEPDASLFRAPDYEVVAAAPISGGILNGKAVSKPAPSYPAEARAAGASGTVVVRILVGEDGTVESAEAVSGHPLLHDAAVEAAKKSRFSPTRLSGQPVKVSGTVTYNFVLM